MKWTTIKDNDMPEEFWPEYVDGRLKSIEVDVVGKTYKISCDFASLTLTSKVCLDRDIKVGGSE